MSKSAIKDSIQSDQIKFLKEGNKEDSSTLRFALSFLNKEEKDKKIELNDSEVIKILKSMIKICLKWPAHVKRTAMNSSNRKT